MKEELKIRPGGGERVSRPLAGKKESFPKKRSVERLVSLFRDFQERMNHVIKI